jgi:hypothetical protein
MPDVAVGEGPIVVRVQGIVPEWLSELVVVGASVGRPVLAELQAPAGLGDDALAGWEIGAATAVLRTGAEVAGGIDAVRLTRVRAIVRSLGAAGIEEPEP